MPAARPARLVALALAGGLGACGGGGKLPAVDCAGPRPPACDAFRDLACLDPCRALADVEALSAPAMEGRGSRMELAGNLLAVERVEQRFAELGLQRVPGLGGWRQPFPLLTWWPGPAAAVEVEGVPARFEGVLFSAAGDVSAELVFAGYGITAPAYSRAGAAPGGLGYGDCPLPEAGYDDYAGVDVAGKIAVVGFGLPGGAYGVACPPAFSLCGPGEGQCWPDRVRTKVRNAEAHGAAAVILVTTSADSPAPRWVQAAGGTPERPGIPVLFAHRADLGALVPGLDGWLAAVDGLRLPSSHATGVAGRVRVTGSMQLSSVDNVLGVLPGADPDPAVAGQVVVVGAHLDHLGRTPWSGLVFPGADDNASGTAVMLELARAFAGSATRPRRTLLFAAWNAEERGLLGSCFYTDVDPRYPLSRTVAALAVDMVGQGDETGLQIYGTDIDPLPQLAAVMSGAAAQAGLRHQVNALGTLEGSDHVCFSYQGVPAALAITPEPHLGYHTPEDRPDRVTAPNLDAAARLLFGLVRAYAMAEEGRFLPGAARATRAPGPAPAASRAPHGAER